MTIECAIILAFNLLVLVGGFGLSIYLGRSKRIARGAPAVLAIFWPLGTIGGYFFAFFVWEMQHFSMTQLLYPNIFDLVLFLLVGTALGLLVSGVAVALYKVLSTLRLLPSKQ